MIFTPTRRRLTAHASGCQPFTAMSARTACWPDERQIRHRIDRVVGRALVDHSFAARLLAEPELAMETLACTPAQYRAVCEIQAQDLDDFARQIFALFWG